MTYKELTRIYLKVRKQYVRIYAKKWNVVSKTI